MIILQVLLALFLINNFGAILASPFLDSLSEQVEKVQKQLVVPQNNFFVSLKLSVRNALIGLILNLRTWLLFLPINFIPGIGTAIYFVVSLWANALANAQEYLALPLDRRLVNYEDEKALVADNRMVCAGFGLAVNLLTIIPLVHLALLPAATVGGTLLFTDLWRNGKFTPAVAEKCQNLTFKEFNNDHSRD